MVQIILQIAIFIITVLMLVTIHELGHFLVAKRLGIQVLKFSVGFGRPLVRWRAKNGTEYAIAWIPLGGYVRLLDEREAPVPEAQQPFAFNRQSLVKRSLVVLAGPGINIVFAILAFWTVWMMGITQTKPVIGEIVPASIAAQSGMRSGETITAFDHRLVNNWTQIGLGLVRRLGESGTLVIAAGVPDMWGIHVYNLLLANWKVDTLNPDPLKSLGIVPYSPPILPIIDTVTPGTAAEAAGLKPGDKIIRMDEILIKDWKEASEIIQMHPQQSLHLDIIRDGKMLSIIATPERRLSGLHWVGFLGVKPKAPVWPENIRQMVKLSPLDAFYRALGDTWDYTAFHFIVLGKMVVGKISLSSLGGPISIYQATNRAFREGLVMYIAFLGLISVMLACVNILPIPGLDGGHLLFFLIEAIIRKPVSVRAQVLFFRIGFILLAVLIFHAMVNDLMRLMN
ncbi:MAG: family rane endopeptidase [Gammaproteobacteria bacterium]|nr:family rane endopeptidase [Gammaproteobacteria bacterium]